MTNASCLTSDIDNCIKQHKIPLELIFNADQTPSSYISVGLMTMAGANSQSVPIKGLTDKRSITLTFVISLSCEFLPLQITYQGKLRLAFLGTLVFPRAFVSGKTQSNIQTRQKQLAFF